MERENKMEIKTFKTDNEYKKYLVKDEKIGNLNQPFRDDDGVTLNFERYYAQEDMVRISVIGFNNQARFGLTIVREVFEDFIKKPEGSRGKLEEILDLKKNKREGKKDNMSEQEETSDNISVKAKDPGFEERMARLEAVRYDFQEAARKYKEKEKANEETRKSLLTILGIKKINGNAQDEEDMLRRKMEEKKQIVDMLEKNSKADDIVRREDDKMQKRAFEIYKEDQEFDLNLPYAGAIGGVVSESSFEKNDAPEKFKRDVRVVSVDENVRRMARRQVDDRMEELLHAPEEGMASTSRFRSILNNLSVPFHHPIRFGQKIWVRALERGYRNKFYQEALEQITQNQNLMIELERNHRMNRQSGVVDANAKREENFAFLDKVMEEYSNNAVEMEERGEKITDPRLDAKTKRFFYSCLMASHRNGGMMREVFETKQRALMNGLKASKLITNVDFLGKGNVQSGMRNEEEVAGGMMYSSNLYEIFQDYQKHIGGSLNEIGIESEKRGEALSLEQKEQLREHVNGTLALDVELGAKLADVFNRRPEGNLAWSDRAIDWLQNSNIPVLRRIASNPGAAALLGAVGGNFASRGVLRLGLVAGIGTAGLVSGAWLPVLTGALSAGVFGAMRRNKELKYDRAMHQRQRTEGREYSDRFRRGRMEEFQYDIKSTKELDDELEGIIKATADNGGHYRNIPEEQKELLASMFARYKLELSQERQRRAGMSDSTFDLISAASPEEGDKNNTHYFSKTDLKIKLYKYLEQNGLIDDLQKRPTDREFEQLFNTQSCALLDNVRQADRAFAEYRIRSAAMTGTVAGLSGAVGVFAGQALWNELVPGDRYTALDSARDFFKGTGNKKIEEFLPNIAFGGKKLQAGLQEIDFQGEKFKFFVDPKTGITIDSTQSQLPVGWRFENSQDGMNLVHEITAKSEGGLAENWNEFVQKNGFNNSQRVSYHGFKFQGTAPEKGIRALPKTATNLLNNLKLKANSTELMMRFLPDKSGNGDVLVDVSKMLNETLKGASGEKGTVMEGMIKKGGKFFLALSESNNASQYNPILIPMDENGIMRVPAKLAKIFFGYDDTGRLIEKNPGQGMKSFIFDTGMRRDRDGAMIVEGISNRLGESPKLKVPEEIITIKEKFPFDFNPGKIAGTPWAGGLAVTSRWQLEEKMGKEEKMKKEKKENPAERQSVNIVQQEAEKIPVDSMVGKAGEGDRESSSEGVAFSMGNSVPEEIKQSEAVEVFGENQRNNWKDYRKYFNSWDDANELLSSLELSSKEKSDKIDEAIEFFNSFDARNGIFPARPKNKREKFLKMFENFKKKHRNIQISERSFILCLQERLKSERNNQTMQNRENIQKNTQFVQSERKTVQV